MDSSELLRQRLVRELRARQQNTYVDPAEKLRSTQDGDTALAQKAQPGKVLAGTVLLLAGIAIGIAYPGKFSAIFALAAVVAGGSLGIDGIRARRSE